MGAADADVAWARRAARFYRGMGWNPLPSRRDAKRPMLPHARYWDEPVPGWVWKSERFRTSNIQLMTGPRWGLAVIDLDGAAGAREWRRIRAGRPWPRTWVSSRCHGSWHLYFALPDGTPAFGHRDLWKGDGDHEGIELFGDRGLITAPPSRHVETGQRYAWLPGRGPRDLDRPAELPGWILDLPAVRPAAPPPPVVPPLPPPRGLRTPSGRYRREDVERAIAGRHLDIARQFGLRPAAAGPNSSGWVPCHRVHDPGDRIPSASISATTGSYSENAGKPISFWDLLVRLQPGLFADWRAAMDTIGETYGAIQHARVA